MNHSADEDRRVTDERQVPLIRWLYEATLRGEFPSKQPVELPRAA